MTLLVHAYLCSDDGRDLASGLPWLTAREASRVERIAAPRRRREFVLGRLLARHALRTHAGDDAFELRAARGHRPSAVAPDGRAHRAINLSHSHGLIACCIAVEPDVDLGCDVEWVRPRTEASWARLAPSERRHPVFASEERAWICVASGGERERRLYLLWTIKEAIAKASGEGIFRGGLSALCPDPRALMHLLEDDANTLDRPLPVADWHVTACWLETHWLAVATREAARVEIHQAPIDRLFG
jgi:phosphopantetheinyl transferase